MNTKTHIPSKDAALEDSIDRILSALNARGIDIDIVETQNPAPNVFWTHIRSRIAPSCFTNGKGASEKASLASALGEFIERLATNYLFADFYLGNTLANRQGEFDFVHYTDEKWVTAFTETLTPELREFYDPDGELATGFELSDINSATPDNAKQFCTLPFTAQKTGETVYFPVNIIGNLYVSNGMSAGNTETEARVQGLSEIFERYVKNRILAEGIALPTIASEHIPEHLHAPLATLREAGHVVHVFDASLGGRYPVICVTLINRDNGGCLTAFGAHPNYHVAIERTVTELLQGRQIHQLDEFFAPVWDVSLVADPHNLETHFIDSTGLVAWDLYRNDPDYDFVAWDFSGTSEAEYAFLLNLVHEHDTDAYIADYPHLGMYACRIIVPSLSEIYPVEEIVDNNNNVGTVLRPFIFTLPDAKNSGEDNEKLEYVLDTLDELGLDDSELVRQILGLSIEANNPWATMRLGELRTLINLALGDFVTAIDDCIWLLTFGGLSTERERFYRAVKDILESRHSDAPNAFTNILEQVHGEYYATALAHCESEPTKRKTFYCFNAIDGDVTQSTLHQQLLAFYQLGQKAKI